MGNVIKADISKLKIYQGNFKTENDYFNNTVYNTFSSSYLKQCSDVYVVRMANNLDELYKNINSSYSKIDKWWDAYIDDSEKLEKNFKGKASSILDVETLKELFSDLANDASTMFKEANEKHQKENYELYEEFMSKEFQDEFMSDDFYNNFMNSSDAEDMLKSHPNYAEEKQQFIESVKEDAKNGDYEKVADYMRNLKKCEDIHGKLKYIEMGNRKDTYKDYSSITDEELAFYECYVDYTIANNLNDMNDSDFNKYCRIRAESQSGGWKGFRYGFIKAGEDIIDLCFGGIFTAGTVVTGAIDGVQAITGAATGMEWTSVTKKMWEFGTELISLDLSGIVLDTKENDAIVKTYAPEKYEKYQKSFKTGKIIGSVAEIIVETGVTVCITGLAGGGIAALRKIGKSVGEKTGKTIGKKVIKEVGEKVIKETGEETSKLLARETGESFLKKIGQDFSREVGESFGKNVGKDIGEVFGKGITSATTNIGSTINNLMSKIAAMKGAGEGAEKAYQNGATPIEGIISAIFSGGWEGIQWYIGGKIGGFNLFGTEGIIKTVGDSVLTKVANSIVRIVLDGVDGSLDPFANSLIDTIYSKGYYDENGNFVEFDENTTFFEKYKHIFENEGGWSAVATGAAVGVGFSSLGEAIGALINFGVGGSKNKGNVSNTKINSVDDIDINVLNEMATTFEEAGYTPEQIKNMFENGNLESIIEVYNSLIDEKINVKVSPDSKSTITDLDDAINEMSQAFEEAGYTPEQIKNMFANEDLDSIIEKYNNMIDSKSNINVNSGNTKISSINDIDINILNEMVTTFEEAGYTPEQIKNMFENGDINSVIEMYNSIIDSKTNANVGSSVQNISVKDINAQVDEIKNTFEKVGYTDKEINDMFSSGDYDAIIKEYNKIIAEKSNLEKMASDSSDLFIGIFEEEGYSDEEIKALYKNNSPDDVIYKALEIMNSDGFKEKALRNNNPIGLGEYGGKTKMVIGQVDVGDEGWYNVFYTDQGYKILVKDGCNMSDVNYNLTTVIDSMVEIKNKFPKVYGTVKDCPIIISNVNPAFHDGATLGYNSTVSNCIMMYGTLSDDEYMEIFVHESAHAYEGQSNRISYTSEWYNAIINDANVDPDNTKYDGFISSYARNHYNECSTDGSDPRIWCQEDYADSLRMYYRMGEDEFKRRYPNRYGILKKYVL